MDTAIRLGMLTPSSNTVLEPATAALLAETPHITAHFQRLRVLSITLDGGSTGQFDAGPMVAAAEMLADVAGKPVYLGLATNAEGVVRIKPQNLLLNLPLASAS